MKIEWPPIRRQTMWARLTARGSHLPLQQHDATPRCRLGSRFPRGSRAVTPWVPTRRIGAYRQHPQRCRRLRIGAVHPSIDRGDLNRRRPRPGRTTSTRRRAGHDLRRCRMRTTAGRARPDRVRLHRRVLRRPPHVVPVAPLPRRGGRSLPHERLSPELRRRHLPHRVGAHLAAQPGAVRAVGPVRLPARAHSLRREATRPARRRIRPLRLRVATSS